MCRCDNSFLKLICQCSGTVICRIWLHLIISAVWAAGVAYLHIIRKWHMHLDSATLSVPAVVAGMLLVFRTNTAYDRYWEGRKLWTELQWNARVLARTIWICVQDKKDSKFLVEKVSIMNMIVAFLYATKHYLREEYSYEEEDIKEFIGHLPKMFMPHDVPDTKESNLSTTPPKIIKQRKKQMEKVLKENEEFMILTKGRKTFVTEADYNAESNIPVEISFFLTAYIMSIKERGLVDNPISRVLDTAVGNLVKCLGGMERIRRTPIPIAYSTHLHQVIWLMNLSLPFQWVKDLEWVTVPACLLASFAMLGILSIGREIENPFGYDYNDLKLDDYCRVLHMEIMSLISKPFPPVEKLLHSDKNHPIVTDFSLTATKLDKMTYKEVLDILSDGRDYQFGKSNTSLYSDTRSASPHDIAAGDRAV